MSSVNGQASPDGSNNPDTVDKKIVNATNQKPDCCEQSQFKSNKGDKLIDDTRPLCPVKGQGLLDFTTESTDSVNAAAEVAYGLIASQRYGTADLQRKLIDPSRIAFDYRNYFRVGDDFCCTHYARTLCRA